VLDRPGHILNIKRTTSLERNRPNFGLSRQASSCYRAGWTSSSFPSAKCRQFLPKISVVLPFAQQQRIGRKQIGKTMARSGIPAISGRKFWLTLAFSSWPGSDLLALSGKSIDEVVLLEVERLLRVFLFRRCLSPRRSRRGTDFRQSVRRLSSKYNLRGHVGCGGRYGGESFYRVRMPRRWQASALAGNYHGRRFFQGGVRNE
jgi:hypothetical protein